MYFVSKRKKVMNFTSLIASILAPVASAPLYNVYVAVSATFIILMFVAAFAAIILVLLQPGNSQGIDALGGSSETFYGKNKGKSTESMLKRWTVVCLVVLAILAIIFFILQFDAIWTA